MRRQLTDWEINYGDERGWQPVTVPHAWRQDVPVSWEGPATYRTVLDVPGGDVSLVFEGVSYYARVSIDGQLVEEHKGIWTSFGVPLNAYIGKSVTIEVRVLKNGGTAFPVDQVASGFLPFVYHTFGGIYRPVHLVVQPKGPPVESSGEATQVRVEGSRIYVNKKPFYPRGLLSWGWYPELGHPNPPIESIRKEVRQAKAMGFNLIKFCLWAPSLDYLQVLEDEDMFGWIELPIWDPSSDPEHQEQILREVLPIAGRHPNILFWTCGCELNAKVTSDFKQGLYDSVKLKTNSLVKDNSGGSEMYGGDPREFGDFYDFHPYCDTNFYPEVLDSLLPGPRPAMPLLLGEFNDCDIHQDLHRLAAEKPYWASTDDELNAVGVRWQHDLPRILETNDLVTNSKRNTVLERASRTKALFVRKFVQEQVRARGEISGYVITGLRDTPVSSSGFFDDWNEPRFTPEETASWNSPDCLFLIPQRRPPWVAGGNRPGWRSMHCHFTGDVYLKVGLHSEPGANGHLEWQLTAEDGSSFASGVGGQTDIPCLSSTQVGEVFTSIGSRGRRLLRATFGNAKNEWPIWILSPLDLAPFQTWGKHDPAGLLADLPLNGTENVLCTSLPADLDAWLAQGKKVLLLLRGEGTLPMPFWRESAYEFTSPAFWKSLGWHRGWEPFLDITPDRALDPEWVTALGGDVEVLMNRVDVRSYKEHPILIRAGNLIATTLRPFGGLGVSPAGVTKNPAGSHLLRCLLEAFA